MNYHSSSEEDEPAQDTDFKAVNLQDSDEDEVEEDHDETSGEEGEDETGAGAEDGAEDGAEGGAEDDAEDNAEDQAGDATDEDVEAGGDTDSDTSLSESETLTNAPTKKRKRNDPDAFATSMSKILSSKLSTSKRSDPVLSRSKEASTTTKDLADAKLEAKARHKLREEKRAALDKGRVRDVLGLESAETSTAEVVEEERRLKKTAQRGVVKLFNAVRAAQVKGEEAAREARRQGVVGMGKREEKVNEMSKKGFLDLIAGGGKKTAVEA